MSLKKLYIEKFRNIIDCSTLLFNDNLNFIVGENGSGKSSILESIFFAGHGKSFRTSKTEHLINLHQSDFIISITDFNNNQFGINKKNNAPLFLKKNGARLLKLADLVTNFPVQVLTPESFKLFFGGPSSRRKFIDLGLFHVEHSFSLLWSDFNKVHKQRNACLKNKLEPNTTSYWTNLFCIQSEQIAQTRESYLVKLEEELVTWVSLLLPNFVDSFSLSYFKGWSNKKPLNEILKDNLLREVKCGYSLYGAQKFDVKFMVNGLPVEEILSRGQQKLFLIGLLFAQSSLIAKINQLKPILLIDDFGAELDSEAKSLIAKALSKLNCQAIITAIEEKALEAIIPKDNNYNMFHVKHGKITAINK
jgi:DNA replication and repair protein RecF